MECLGVLWRSEGAGTHPTSSETHSRIDVSGTVLWNSTRQRQPSRHLAQTLHHAEDGNTGHRITYAEGKQMFQTVRMACSLLHRTKEHRKGTTSDKSLADT